jgi:hypothetical protein
MVLKPIDTLEDGITASECSFKRHGMPCQNTPLLFDTRLQQPMPSSQIE